MSYSKFYIKAKVHNLIKKKTQRSLMDINVIGSGSPFSTDNEGDPSFLVTKEKENILIGCGKDTFNRLMNRKNTYISSIKNVIINDTKDITIGSLSTLVSYRYKTQSSVTNIICPFELKDDIENILYFFGNKSEEYSISYPDEKGSDKYIDSNIKVDFVHAIEKKFGCILKFLDKDIYLIFSGTSKEPITNVMEKNIKKEPFIKEHAETNTFIFHNATTSKDIYDEFCGYEELENVKEEFPNIYTYGQSQEAGKFMASKTNLVSLTHINSDLTILEQMGVKV